MFKMSMCGAALLLAGLVELACSNHSGLNLGGGSTSGGQGIVGSGGSAGGGQTTGQNDCEKAGGTCEQGAPGACLGGWSPTPGVFLRIEHDVLLSTAQPLALRNRRRDVH